jgi:hypothetical protein
LGPRVDQAFNPTNHNGGKLPTRPIAVSLAMRKPKPNPNSRKPKVDFVERLESTNFRVFLPKARSIHLMAKEWGVLNSQPLVSKVNFIVNNPTQ